MPVNSFLPQLDTTDAIDKEWTQAVTLKALRNRMPLLIGLSMQRRHELQNASFKVDTWRGRICEATIAPNQAYLCIVNQYQTHIEGTDHRLVLIARKERRVLSLVESIVYQLQVERTMRLGNFESWSQY